MATVSDLIQELSRLPGLNQGELRQVARSLQISGLLPHAGMKRKRVPPPIGARHCAVFAIAMACSRTSGI